MKKVFALKFRFTVSKFDLLIQPRWCTVFLLVLVLGSCDLYEYGQLGGADKTSIHKPGDPAFENIMSFMSGVWYSHYAGIGRLDGYRIGKWENFAALVEDSGKIGMFPNLEKETDAGGSAAPDGDNYFMFYDDTVYGQNNTGAGGNGGWNFGYIGIVRAINTFYGNKDRGAVIIEYLKGGAPQWDDDIKDGHRPFFGIYYRVLDNNTVQLANAVDLAALYAGEKYYTEKATLDEAIAFNTVENEAELIAWGVVIPQNREPGE
jgi:hypothetical protein